MILHCVMRALCVIKTCQILVGGMPYTLINVFNPVTIQLVMLAWACYQLSGINWTLRAALL